MNIIINDKEYYYRKEDKFSKSTEIPFRARLSKQYLEKNNLPLELKEQYKIFFKPSDLFYKTDKTIFKILDNQKIENINQCYINKEKNYIFKIIKKEKDNYLFDKIEFEEIIDFRPKEKVIYNSIDKIFLFNNKLIILQITNKKIKDNGHVTVKRYYDLYNEKISVGCFKKWRQKFLSLFYNNASEIEFKKFILKLKLENEL